MTQERDIIAARRLLETIQVERDYPGPGRPSTIPLTKVGRFSISSAVWEEFSKLPGATSHNVERALQLLLILVRDKR